MNQEEFNEWFKKLVGSKAAAVAYVAMEYLMEEAFEDSNAREIRQLVYDRFPEWH